nr:TonB-dependent receptor plug domain-containing protein [uncultured Novosphingobium sp.]
MIFNTVRSRLLVGAATSLLAATLFSAAATAADADAGSGADAAQSARPRRDDIVVTAERGVQTINAATKSTLPIADTPQSISVITSSDIAGLGLQSLNQAMRYVAGVTPETRGTSAEV